MAKVPRTFYKSRSPESRLFLQKNEKICIIPNFPLLTVILFLPIGLTVLGAGEFILEVAASLTEFGEASAEGARDLREAFGTEDKKAGEQEDGPLPRGGDDGRHGVHGDIVARFGAYVRKKHMRRGGGAAKGP